MDEPRVGTQKSASRVQNESCKNYRHERGEEYLEKKRRKQVKQKKEELKAQLSALKESQKTPEDKIKELETKLADLDTVEEF